MTEPIRVVLADDHPLIRSGIRSALDAAPDLLVVGEASDGHSVRQLSQAMHPDVIVLDLHMPGPPPVALVTDLRADRPTVKIIILTAYADDAALRGVVAAGVEGYVLKQEDTATIVAAIRTVARGGFWFSRPVAEKLAQWAGGIHMPTPTLTLTPAEVELLRLIVAGKTNREIGAILGISEKTVEKRVSGACARLGVATRIEAAVQAVRAGLA